MHKQIKIQPIANRSTERATQCVLVTQQSKAYWKCYQPFPPDLCHTSYPLSTSLCECYLSLPSGLCHTSYPFRAPLCECCLSPPCGMLLATLRPKENGKHFAVWILQCTMINGNSNFTIFSYVFCDNHIYMLFRQLVSKAVLMVWILRVFNQPAKLHLNTY